MEDSAPTNEEKPLLDGDRNLLPDVLTILKQVFDQYAKDGKLDVEGATQWVMKCNSWKQDYSRQLATEILSRHSKSGYLQLRDFQDFYQTAARQHEYHVRKDLKQLGFSQYRPLLGKPLLKADNKRLTDYTTKCLQKIFRKFAKKDDPKDTLGLVGATEWVQRCNSWDRTRALSLARELLRTHGNSKDFFMTRENFLKYYRLAATQHPLHVRNDLVALGYEVYKLAPMLTEDEQLVKDMVHVCEDIFYQFCGDGNDGTSPDHMDKTHCEEYMYACLPKLDQKTAAQASEFLMETFASSEKGLTLDDFKAFILEATKHDQDGLRQDLKRLGYQGYAP